MIKLELIKKEIREYLKTPKGLILTIIFLFFAIASPALAKFMNEIIAAVATDVVISFPDPTLEDAWLQFYKNLTSICIIVYLIIMTGTISQEKNKGSILLVLTKKVTRFQLMFTKFFVGSMFFTSLLIVSALIGAWYTNMLFGAYLYEGLLSSLLMLWLMGIFFTTLAIFVSILGKTPTTSALLGFFGFALLSLPNISTDLALFNPAGASSIVNGVIAGMIDINQLWIPMTSSLVMTIILLIISYLIFKRQEL